MHFTVNFGGSKRKRPLFNGDRGGETETRPQQQFSVGGKQGFRGCSPARGSSRYKNVVLFLIDLRLLNKKELVSHGTQVNSVSRAT